MDTLEVIFRTVQEHCEEQAANEECFVELEKLTKDRHTFLSHYVYLEVLQNLGLIIFSNQTKGIILTEKGKVTDHYSLVSLHASFLLFLYFLRRMFLFILFGLMFIVLWPMFILVQNPYSFGRKKNSAG